MKKLLSFFLLLGAFLSITINLNAQTPVISAINPSSAAAGSTVIIAGSNFTGVTGISFGGVPATSYTVISSSAITAVVGNGASGSVSVTNASGTGSLAGFNFIAASPTISSFSPASGPIGTTVTINGTNFSTTPANNIVYFGAVKSVVTAATTSTLTVTVPAGASYQPITVTTNNLTAYSSKPFIVIFSGAVSTLSTGNFSSNINITNGYATGTLAVGDLDNDGKPDIITGEGNNSYFSAFRNTSSQGHISFASNVDFALAGVPYGLSLGDFDGDGKLDVVQVSYTANASTTTASVYRNNSTVGNISFTSRLDLSAGNSYTVTVGDIDGDGKPDIICSNMSGNSVSVFRNTSTVGNISFAARVDFSIGSQPINIAVGDLDGDGKPDICAVNQNANQVSIILNTSTVGIISFNAAKTFATGTGPRGVSIGDLDGDGKPDLAVANSGSASASILRNTSSIGSLSFAAHFDLTVGSTPIVTTIGDIDGDGIPDVGVACAGSNYVSLLKSNSTIGSLSFNSAINLTDNSPYSLAFLDLDGDGITDVIASNVVAPTTTIFRNQQNQPTVTSFTPASGVSGTTVIISGINFTGVTAVSFGGVAASSFTYISPTAIIATVGSGSSGSVSVTTPLGTGSLTGFTFIVPVPTITSFSPSSGAIGTSVTITGTNFSTTASNNLVYFGAVKATVTAVTSTSLTVTVPYGTTFQPITVTTNNLTAYSSKPFIVTFPGGGNTFTTSTFGNKIDYTVGSAPNMAAIGDIDGDGKADVVAVNGSANTLSILRNISSSGNINLTSKVDFNTNGDPTGACIADLDGDGKPDIAFVKYNSNILGIFRNTSSVGNISLASEIDFTTGTSPAWLAIGDFDGDGKPDIVVCNSANTASSISVFLNTSTLGNISFANKIDYSIGSGSWAVAVGDIDGDGKTDIVAANTNSTLNSVSVFRNISTGQGNISFASEVRITTGAAPRCVSIGDIDGDGKLDIVTGNASAANVSILRNISSLGSISFAAKSDFSVGTGSTPIHLSITDLDGDGKPDLTVAVALSSVSTIRNLSTPGNISFDPSVSYTTGSGTWAVSSGDIDGDGKPDIVVANASSTSISILRNQVAEPVITSFTPTSAANSGSVIISGVNFTGTTTVSFGGVSASSFTVISSTAIIATVGSGASGCITVTTPYGTASSCGFTFTVPIPTITDFSPTSGAIGTTVTITGTNFSTTSANNIVYFGAAKATVTSSTATSLTVTVPSGTTYQPITVTTRNLTAFSAKPFTVTFAGGGSYFTSTSFKTKTDFKVDSGSNSLASSDFDGDGKVDLIVTNKAAGSISILRNISTSGNISFATKVNYTTSGTPWGICVFDLDGDGKQDIAAANYNSNTVGIFRNTSSSGSVSVSSEIDYATGTSPNFVTVSDFDGDGKPDLVVSNSYSATVSVYLNTSTPGNISFAAKIDFAVGGHPNVITIADIDGDGKPDIISANQTSNSISVLRNTSSGIGSINFATQVSFTSGGTPYPIAVGDIDGDGKLDIVTGNANAATVSIFTNSSTSGNISFASHTDFSTGTSTVPIAIALTDLDGDGKLDISVAGASPTNVVSLLRNLSTSGNVNFYATVNYATGLAPYSVAIGDIDGDGKPDIAVANANSSSVSVLRNQIGEPVITSFTPTAQSTGQSVIISGANFTGTTSVTFGGVAATSFTVVSSTAIIATVGNGATGSVTITTPNGSATLAGFTYTGTTLPTITSFTPTTAPTGTTVTITGTNFTGATAVSFGGTAATTFTVVNATTITAVVANGATGSVSVTTPNGTASLGGFTYCNYSSPVININSNQGNTVCKGSFVTITAFVTNPGTPIFYFWQKNGVNVGANINTYTDSSLKTGDSIVCTYKCTTVCGNVSYAGSNTLRFNVLSSTTQYTSATGCNSVVYKGTTYTSSTTRTDTLRSGGGCDSVYLIATITVNKITAVTNPTSISSCNSVVYKGITYTSSATERDTVRSFQGCDSIYNVATITINKITPVTNPTSISGCNSVVYKGITYTSSSTERDTVRSFQGCDSIYNIVTITVNKLTAISNPISINGCNSLVYKGITYTSSATERDTVRSVKGCDSIYNVATITINKLTAITNPTSINGCNSVVYKGITYTSSATERDTVRSVKGCDSIYNIATITVNKLTAITNPISISGCNSVVYKGITYTSSAIERDTVRSVKGCDSIYNIATITVNKLTAITNLISISGCNSVVYKGITYTSSAIERDTVRSVKGCDSIYNIATITVNKISVVTNPISVIGCDSIAYKGLTYYSTATKRDTVRSYQGCDSIYNVATITVTPTPVITGISSNSPVNTGDSIKLTVTANSGNLYSWTGPLSFKSTAQNPTIYSATSSMSGTYYVNVSNGTCKSLTDSVVVNISSVYSISGTVWHPKGYAVQNVALNVAGQLMYTDVNGGYSTKLLGGGNYSVVPLNIGRSLSALRNADRITVSTLDVALVQSHILQKSILNSPYKIIAADVNSDGHVSALDIVYMKRLILAIDTSFPGNKLWGYVDSGYVFADQTNPFPFTDSFVYSNLNANAANQSFIGFVLGDVNWSATAPRMVSGQSVELNYNNINAANADVIKVPFSVKNFNNLIGMQYTMKYNNEAFDFVGLNNNVLGMEYAVHDNGSISFIWNSNDNELKTLQDGSTIFELVLKPKSIVQNESLNLSSDITAIEAVDGNFELHEIILQKGVINNEPVIAEESWNLVPNPTDGIIKINMNTKVAKTINFELNDMNGKVLLSQKMELVKGVNNFNLNLQAQNRLASGTYYLKAKGIEGEMIKKVIVR